MPSAHLQIDPEAGIVVVRIPRGRIIALCLFGAGLALAALFGAWIQDLPHGGVEMSPAGLADALQADPPRALLLLLALLPLVPALVVVYDRVFSLQTTFDLRTREVRAGRRGGIPLAQVTSLIYMPPIAGARLSSLSLALTAGRPRLLFLGLRKSETLALARGLADTVGLPLELDGFHSPVRSDASWTLRILLPLIAIAALLAAALMVHSGLRQGQLPGASAVGFFLLTLGLIVTRIAWIQWLPPSRRPARTFGPWVYYGFCGLFTLGAAQLIWQDYRAIREVEHTGWSHFLANQIGEPTVLLMLGMAWVFWLGGRRAARSGA